MHWKIWSGLVHYLSAECILSRHPNGGSVILLRALWITFLVTVASLLLVDVLDPKRQFAVRIDLAHAASFVVKHYKEIAAAFGGIYLALYARFSSQWTYLANAYNQIMQTKAGALEVNRAAMAAWEAGFVEDAVALHLHRKPMFAEAVLHILEKPASRIALERSIGTDRVMRIRVELRDARRSRQNA